LLLVLKHDYFKVTFFFSNKIILVDLIFCSKVTANVLQLGEVAVFEALTFNLALNFF
jgi:hypothetical protein